MNIVSCCPWRPLLLVLSLFFLAVPIYALANKTEPLNNIPEDSIKDLPLAAEQSVSTFLPTIAAIGRGLAINIIYPEKPRYKNGAPIVIVIPAGDGANGLNFCLHAAQVGCVEIRFALPGGGSGAFKSSGFNDYRGPESQKALRDIFLFAAGKMQDFRGRNIVDLVPLKLDLNNIGVVGWSNGGNIALVTMEKFAQHLNFINWLILYECPLGSLFFPPSLGSTDYFLLNNHYRQGSAATSHCLIDFRKLAWQADAQQNPGIDKKLGKPELPGVVFFDDNGNNKWDESAEFAFKYCIAPDLNKKIYAPDVTAALERLKIFAKNSNNSPPTSSSSQANNLTENKARGQDKIKSKVRSIKNIGQAQEIIEDDTAKVWPSTVATLNEAENYFQERDGALSIPAICTLYPNLLITIFASQVDHLQTQPDHPHIVLQYNAFLDHGAHWVRLNPESIYLADLANMNKRNFVQNEPNVAINAENITDYLEPEGVLSDYVFINAAIAELADRKQANNIASPLNTVIYPYSNGLPVPPSSQASPAQKNTDKKAN